MNASQMSGLKVGVGALSAALGLFAFPAFTQSMISPESSPKLRGFVQVAPSGALVEPAQDLKFQYRTDTVRSGDTLDALLTRNGLYGNKETIEAVKKLNPGLVYDSDKVKTGQKFQIYAPDTPGGPGPRVTLIEPSFSKALFTTNRLAVTRYRASASPDKFASPEDYAVYRNATFELERASSQLEKVGDRLNKRQLALATFYLDQASLTAETLAKGSPTASGRWDKTAVGALQQNLAPVSDMSKLLQEGRIPFDRKKVTIHVLDSAGRRIDNLRVYVLPDAAIKNLANVSETTMLALLETLSFEQVTSPATQLVEVADLYVWVGPDYKHKEMIKLIRSGKVPRHKLINSVSGSSALTHTFSEADITRVN